MKKIQNKYSYLEENFIGQGAYSKVYKGLNLETNENVAIKCIDWDQVQDRYFINGFQREMRILRDLNHMNVIKMYDMVRESNLTFLVLEYCDSQNLAQLMEKSGGKLDESISKIVLQQLLAALQELISKSYLHRDLKPENILIHQKTLKLADFGFATQADYSGIKLLSENVGTPLYMSPQLLENKHYTVKSDIWSVGMIAYEMITGEFPWKGEDPQELLKSIKSQPLQFPPIPISKEYRNFITGCLQIREEDRLSWDDLFEHEVFKKKCVIQRGNKENIQSLCQLALKQIKQMVKDRGTPIEQLFANLDMDGDHKLNFEEFQILLLYVNNFMDTQVQRAIFKQYNKSQNNLLNFDEFTRIFQ